MHLIVNCPRNSEIALKFKSVKRFLNYREYPLHSCVIANKRGHSRSIPHSIHFNQWPRVTWRAVLKLLCSRAWCSGCYSSEWSEHCLAFPQRWPLIQNTDSLYWSKQYFDCFDPYQSLDLLKFQWYFEFLRQFAWRCIGPCIVFPKSVDNFEIAHKTC